MISSRWTSVLGLLFVLSGTSGCASPWVVTGGPNSPTDGLSIELLMEGQAQQMVRLRLNGDGLLMYAGGRDVAQNVYSWEGVIDRADGQAVAAAVREGHWFEDPPTGDGSESKTWWIKAWGRHGKHAKFTVYGHAASLEAVYDILNRIASARFNSFLKEFPKPSLDRQFQRKTAIENAVESEDDGTPGNEEDKP